MSEEPLLRPEEVAGVLAGLDGDATPDLSGDGPCMPIPYSLREPVALPQEAEPYARKKVESMAAALEACWRRELATELSIEVEGFQQQRAGVALSVVPSPAWTFGFLDPAGGGVAIVLDPGIGLALVEAALGGAGKPVDTGRAPTPLESRVMDRLGSAAAAGIRAAAAASALVPTGLVVGALPAGLASDGETLGVGLLRIRLPQGERAALLLATAPILSPPAETTAVDAAGKVGPLAARLGRVRLTVRPVLPAGLANLGELSDLASGAVLRLDAQAGAPLDLRVAGQTIFRGHVIKGTEGPAFAATWRRARSAGAAGRKR